MEEHEDLFPFPDKRGKLLLRGIESLSRDALYHSKIILHLDVSGNGLESLPREVGKLTLLRVLDVSRNQLRTLPRQIGRCGSMVTLLAGENRLESVPDTIGHCTLLEELHLPHNNLTALPHTVGHLSALRVLSAEHNALLTIPPELALCLKLETVNFFANPVANVPQDFLTDLAMIQWQCRHNLSFKRRIADLETSSRELEAAARDGSEQRMLLFERLTLLQREHQDLSDKTARYRSCTRNCADACVLQ